jgi:hypothetical protein
MFLKSFVEKEMPGHSHHGSQHGFVSDSALPEVLHEALSQSFMAIGVVQIELIKTCKDRNNF